MARFKFRATNIDAIVSRATKLALSITNGSGANAIRKEAESAVIHEYQEAFDRAGFPGNPWKSSKRRISLQRTGAFRQSFDNISEFDVRSGGNKLIIKFANAFTHPRLNDEPYVVLMRRGLPLDNKDKNSINLNISGKVGGISQTGAEGLFSAFRQIVANEAKRVGYT